MEKNKKTKLKNIMYDRGISLTELHNGTGISFPILLDIKQGRRTLRTEFYKRTIRDLEQFLSLPAEEFLGWEELKKA
jgi:transcriptional regulator with XRE-family HTH domain